ncbi:MAG: hypothetical protein HY735_01815 [Verrucomicrobia bacterium]|nr:hypothetical protein [Verrucomicrobiota bacterium]
MKKTLIGVGLLVIGLAVIAAVSRLKVEQTGESAGAGAGPSASCCPLPVEQGSQKAAAYKCESCGTTYEKAGDCCGKPTKKVDKQP